MPRGKYASQYLNNGEYIYTPGLQFYLDYNKLTTEYPDSCVLVALTEQDIHLLLLLLDLTSFYKIWGFEHKRDWDSADQTAWDTIEAFTNNLRLCLMSGCQVSDLITAINGVEAAIRDQNPAMADGKSSNDVLDEVAEAQGVDAQWTLLKGGLSILFPETAIPISIGLDVIRGLVDNSNSNEAETFEIAKMLGSTSVSLPD